MSATSSSVYQAAIPVTKRAHDQTTELEKELAAERAALTALEASLAGTYFVCILGCGDGMGGVFLLNGRIHKFIHIHIC